MKRPQFAKSTWYERFTHPQFNRLFEQVGKRKQEILDSGKELTPIASEKGFCRRYNIWAFPLVALLVLHPLGRGAIAHEADEVDFSGTGRPNKGKSAGSRGSCNFDLTSLVPVDEQGGWTTQANPTLWLQVPMELSSIKSILVMVKDESGSTVYRTEQENLDASAGIVRLPLPETVQLPVSNPDSEDKSGFFNWMVAMYCDDSGDRPAYVEGSIRRVAIEAPSELDLEGKSPQEIIELSNLYTQNRIWYDALTVLGNARLAAPNDQALLEAWQKLLSYPIVGLEAVVNEPLVECCTLPQQ
ncbi:MAG: DUF928 domain-containing protein [Symploca sp. SIO2E9]|nr:DUF928 domain-containing protein [Symploca sp. SIO2E9]